MTQLLSTFTLDNRRIEIWHKTKDGILPEDTNACDALVLAMIESSFGKISPMEFQAQLKQMTGMAVSYSNIVVALLPYLRGAVEPKDIPMFLRAVFDQMSGDEYDYLRKWEEMHNEPEGADQAAPGEEADPDRGAGSPGPGDGPQG